MRRKEDRRFITGTGHYTDDINRPGQTYAYFIRSPHAHATIKSIDAKAASGMPGVLAVLTGAELELLRQGIDANLARPSPRAKVASSGSDPGSFIEDFCNWQENEDYRRFIFGSALGEVGAQLMKSRAARLYHDHMLTKEAGTQARTPWHQDQPYYNIAGTQNCSFWIPVDPVSRESTLEFVAGSHLGPWLMPRSFMTSKLMQSVRDQDLSRRSPYSLKPRANHGSKLAMTVVFGSTAIRSRNW